ncbi:hypothetical protein EXIGLDRAFT_487518 [Exidia glandulosa HHB12029]|uniref:F-box domain-containing protein n=1 Tax=Exidia glandulosa HHB12029 TaxID=1314781 RepID=A0A165JNH6_EXIGL|nr:hypothetical protein EXIGLDRAFT_487518 [Exidia glandulosa HHB12029]
MNAHCKLPLELVGCIIHFSSIQAQLALALASRTFNRETNRVLYSSVRVASFNALEALATTTASNPSLAACIDNLTIDMLSTTRVDFELGEMSNLRHISLNMFAPPIDFLENIQEDQLLSFHAAYDRTNDSLKRRHARFLGRQRRLKRLSLDQRLPLSKVDVPCLEELVCTPSTAIALGPAPRPLRNVVILGTVDLDLLAVLLVALPPCVQSLDIILDDGFFPRLFAITDALPALESLQLCLVSLSDFETMAKSGKLPRFPALRTLTISLDVFTDISPDEILPTCTTLYTRWKKSAAPKLTTVNLSYEDYHTQGSYTIGEDPKACRVRDQVMT